MNPTQPIFSDFVEKEITSVLPLDVKQAGMLDMHSLLNILNVLIGELNLIGFEVQKREDLQPCYQIAEELKLHLGDSSQTLQGLSRLEDMEKSFFQTLDAAISRSESAREIPDIKESIQNLLSVFRIFKTRSQELILRSREPDAWKTFEIARLHENFCNVLAAIEKNAKGRYRIIYNIAAQEPVDYLVDLKIQSVGGSSITMPPVIQDVLRDLIANARKYTPPGGQISAGLLEKETDIVLAVQDNGRGIPPDEITEVVNFGRRGSNVDDVSTKGGGFGLTKAYCAVKRFGGRMWIRSALGRGTRVTIKIPKD